MGIKGRNITGESDLKAFQMNCYEKSKAGQPFYNILDFMKSEQVIMKAVHNIKSNHGSSTAGVDGKTIRDYLTMDTDELLELIRGQIDNYQPQLVLRRYIPKSNGKLRPLGIPVLVDRIIQEIARLAIEPFFEAKFFDHSYGFRPLRSTEHAVARITQLIRSGSCIAIEGDIKSFFDNISHNKLIEMLWGYGIRDQRFLTIIKRMLRSQVLDNGVVRNSSKGTPQGGIISPLLANIYLNGFDWMICKLWENHSAISYKQRVRNGKTLLERNYRPLSNKGVAYHEKMNLIRYADDWVILCQTKEYAERLLSRISKYFWNRLGLELSLDKTLITDCREKPIKFLGFDLKAERKRNGDNMVGKVLPNLDRVLPKVREIAGDIRRLRDQPNVLLRIRDIELINSKIIGLTNYYRIGSSKRLFSKIDHLLHYVTKNTFKSLYKKNYRDHHLQLRDLSNRINRHDKYKFKTFAEKFSDNCWIGLTIAAVTSISYSRCFNPNWTPYTEDGWREWSDSNLKPRKWHLEDIWTNYEQLGLRATLRGSFYNFEYWMNRQYAIKRDKAKCVCCRFPVYPVYVHVHHRRPYLGLSQVNRVGNLTTLCPDCHHQVHNEITTDNKQVLGRILKLRNEIQYGNGLSETL